MALLSSQLQAALDSLTPATWRKNNYFKVENNTLCMCAHGAIQAQVNPQVKLALENLDSSDTYANDVVRAVVARAANMILTDVLDVWTNRPDWVKQDRIYNGNNYGNQDLHFLLGMVGLTVRFNDAHNTTLKMVQEKFRAAIRLAQELGV